MQQMDRGCVSLFEGVAYEDYYEYGEKKCRLVFYYEKMVVVVLNVKE